MAIEQEVKLAFDTIEAARQAVDTAGGRLVVSRRLISDALFETPDQRMRRTGATLRIRRDGTHGYLTWKGPQRAGPVKSREELETSVGTPDVMEAALVALGYSRWFSAEKYREEYELGGAHVTIDDTPAGVFVEIEAEPAAIALVARRLNRSEADYRLESYPALWRRWCEERGRPARDMLFAHAQVSPT